MGGEADAALHLGNSYSVVTNLSAFLRNIRLSKLRGQTLRVEQVRDTLLSRMGIAPIPLQAG